MPEKDKNIRKIVVFAVLIVAVYIMVVAPVFGTRSQDMSGLIAATGTSGQSGYVKQSDIDRFDGKLDDIPVLRDAVRFSRTLEDPVRIPLYKKDGTTVIGSFPLISKKLRPPGYLRELFLCKGRAPAEKQRQDVPTPTRCMVK